MKKEKTLSDPLPGLKYVLLTIGIAFAAGIALSFPLWINGSGFPTSPVFPVGDIFQFPFDHILIGLLFIHLLIWPFFDTKKWFGWSLISLLTLLLLGDQNRWQPWVFEYSLIVFSWFVLVRGNNKHKAAYFYPAVRIILTGIYLWSGLQKFNENYFIDTSYWIMEPIDTLLGWTHRAGKIAWVIPPLEVLLALGLLFIRTRKISAIILGLMHVFIMLEIGVGRGYNIVIQPWNLCNILLLWLLLTRENKWDVNEISLGIRKNIFVLLIFILTWICPTFSLFNKWDSYLSARLYSGNSSNGYVFITEKVKAELPEDLRKYVQYKDSSAYIYINNWSMEELSVPCYPEKRVYKKAMARIRSYTNTPGDVILLITDQFNMADTTDVEVVN